jgi:hypothetical protein
MSAVWSGVGGSVWSAVPRWCCWGWWYDAFGELPENKGGVAPTGYCCPIHLKAAAAAVAFNNSSSNGGALNGLLGGLAAYSATAFGFKIKRQIRDNLCVYSS